MMYGTLMNKSQKLLLSLLTPYILDWKLWKLFSHLYSNTMNLMLTLLNDRLLKRMCHNLQSAQICSKAMVSNCIRIVPFILDWQFCTTILVILFGSMFRSLSSLVAWLLPFSVLIYRVLCSESIDLMPGSTRLSSYYDYYYFYSPFNFLSRQGRRRRRITPNSILKVSQKWACD